MEAIRRNLKDQILTNDNAIMVCNVCGSECSANAGDYWNYPDNHVFTCCGKVMSIVTKHIVYRDVVYQDVTQGAE